MTTQTLFETTKKSECKNDSECFNDTPKTAAKKNSFVMTLQKQPPKRNSFLETTKKSQCTTFGMTVSSIETKEYLRPLTWVVGRDADVQRCVLAPGCWHAAAAASPQDHGGA